MKGQKRAALVIGNNEYKEPPLKNPVHDAEDISNVLRGLGFTVQTKINADQRGMEEAVKEFVREIQNGYAYTNVVIDADLFQVYGTEITYWYTAVQSKPSMEHFFVK